MKGRDRSIARNATRGTVLALALAALTALTACGGSGTPAGNASPTASFTATPTSGPHPLVVTFDASGSADADGSITSYAWDFGDGATATGASVQHTYVQGAFTAKLTVNDNVGAADDATRAVSVSAPAPAGTVSGSVDVATTSTAVGGVPLSIREPTAGPAFDAGAEFVPGEILVKFEPGVGALALQTLEVAGVRLERARTLTAGVGLYRARNLDRAQTAELAAALSRRPDVRYAHPNFIRYAQAAPNDTFYSFQWHYPAIDLESAWDITTGATDSVVAIVDSGILFAGDGSPNTHPDFVGKVLPGYDFISDPTNAQDGDGRDSDPFDPVSGASYHGSHVGGTVAAATDNGTGIAGVDWQAKLVAIRALGATGGSIADIMEGAAWAAGFEITGVPTNANPAQVINMSLGGPGACSDFEQEVLDLIRPRAIVVIAAGNSGDDTSGYSPANCTGSIVVGATETRGHRATYSNYGDRIDVMAPGGDTSVDLNTDGYYDGVLSVAKFEDTGDFGYDFLQGTSMAAPHVAGVVSLMRAVKPDLTAAEALSVLQSTAAPLDATKCERPSGTDCGAGLIDARAALQMLKDGTVIPVPGELVLTPDPLDYGTSTGVLALTLENAGSQSLAWQVAGFTPAAGNPGTLANGVVSVSSTSGTLTAGATSGIDVVVDRSKASDPGTYSGELELTVDGATTKSVTVTFTKESGPSLTGKMVVASFVLNATGDNVLSGLQESNSTITSFSFPALAGSSVVVAWSDENANDVVDVGDYYGEHPNVLTVVSGAESAAVNIAMALVSSSASSSLESAVTQRSEDPVR